MAKGFLKDILRMEAPRSQGSRLLRKSEFSYP